MNMERGSLDHALKRADYYKGLLTKTTDPVFWDGMEGKKVLEEAFIVLDHLVKAGHRRYLNALSAADAALDKAHSKEISIRT